MENTRLYEAFKQVPEDAKKKITGGRLKGFTDINPMWRIKKLTEQFGPCGEGWNTRLINERMVPGGNKGEVALFVDIELVYKLDSGEWSAPIFGTGGSTLVANETGGLRLDDEAYKKAYTDAISVACKALGIGADVYWDKDSTKYPTGEQDAPESGAAAKQPEQEYPPDEIPDDDVLGDIKHKRADIIALAQVKGLDEKALAMKAEGYIETKYGVFTKFGAMNMEQLLAVENKIKSL